MRSYILFSLVILCSFVHAQFTHTFIPTAHINDGGFAYGVYVGADGTVFLANDYDGLRAYSYDGSAFTPTAHIDDGGSARNVAVDGDGTAFLANSSSGLRAYNYDGSAFINTAHIDNGGSAVDVCVGADGTVFLANRTDGLRAYSYDGGAFTNTAHIDDGGYATGVAVGDDGKVFLANRTDGLRAYSYDGSAFINTAHINDGGEAWGVAVGADGTVYLANMDDGLRAYNYDGSSFSNTAHINDGGFAYGVYVGADGTVFLANGSDLRAYSYDGSAFTNTAHINDGGSAYGVAVGGDGTVFLANLTDGLRAYNYSPMVNIADDASVWNVNEIAGWIHHDGRSSQNPSQNSGVYFPRGTATVVYQDGIIWGAIVRDIRLPNEPKMRVGGQTYNIGTTPGHIVTSGTAITPPVASDANQAFIYRIRKDWQSLSIGDPRLIRDAAEINQVDITQVTAQMQQDVIDEYANDWNNWPNHIGAPLNIDSSPGIADADQVIWLVINDMDSGRTNNLYGSPPIGLEVQITIWGYEQYPEVSLRRYRIINKSGCQLDSMFVAQWVDPDVGAFDDDFSGCDSLLELAYAYNSTPTDVDFDPFNLPPPAIGYTLLQGPIVPGNPGDEAIFDFHRKPGYRNLPVTSIVFYAAGSPIPDPTLGDYEGTLMNYNLLNGYLPEPDTLLPSPYLIGSGPNTGQSTKFPLAGDPVAGNGDIDGTGDNFPAGDRRNELASGPFYMQPGDTQEVVVAMVGSIRGPGNNIDAVADLKSKVQQLRELSDNLLVGFRDKSLSFHIEVFMLRQNYPNPFNPKTTISYQLPKSSWVNLSIYNLLGEEIATLVSEQQQAGSYSVDWDAHDMVSGIYLYRLKTDEGFVETKKMVLLR